VAKALQRVSTGLVEPWVTLMISVRPKVLATTNTRVDLESERVWGMGFLPQSRDQGWLPNS